MIGTDRRGWGNMDVTSGFQVNVTVVSNDFIDRYMASANGEYVKVYLFVLRHQQEGLDLERIADSLNHTEADVKRALLYWEKLGALQVGAPPKEEPKAAAPSVAEPAEKRKPYSQDRVNALAGDEDFAQLLYIAQKYLSKVFTPRECEVFAYLYDGLKMSVELLEYLTEYCAQNGHTSIRYLETVALNWHEKGLHTVEQAKAYASGFGKDSFAVMKAFGLTERRPGEAELEQIERWFTTYGFSKDVVLEACNRTLAAIHSPSFRYADKILEQWKHQGVKNLQDIAALDQKRQTKPAQPQNTGKTGRKPANQFHNFEQRNTDYDSMVIDQVKSWIGK